VDDTCFQFELKQLNLYKLNVLIGNNLGCHGAHKQTEDYGTKKKKTE